MTGSAKKIIDPHLHFFNLQQGDYHWLKPNQPPLWPDKQKIYKNFTQSDLTLDSGLNLAGFVHIEAGFNNQQPWREIDWLEQHCIGSFKTVAFADITATSFADTLNQLTHRQSVVGIRHILDDQAAKILSADLTKQHFGLLAEKNFSFDAQLSLLDERSTDALVEMANLYKTVAIIINHAGRAPLQNAVNEHKIWQFNLQKLASCKNIAIKLSGWEMTDRTWQAHHASTVIHDSISTMGESRVMLASNFPLCLFTMPYKDLWETYAEQPDIEPKTFEKISYTNAKTWYKF